jgi:hypothetical protein
VLDLTDLANMFNPVIRGWIHYYGAFWRSELIRVFRPLQYALVTWVMRKYKRFKGSRTIFFADLRKGRRSNPLTIKTTERTRPHERRYPDTRKLDNVIQIDEAQVRGAPHRARPRRGRGDAERAA